MKDLSRLYVNGVTHFFTVVTDQRRPILCDAPLRSNLRNALQRVRMNYPFEIVAWVLLPDHLHTIWSLPKNDPDYSTRWRLVKGIVSHQMKSRLDLDRCRSQSQIRKGESGLWQHRFLEHTIRDENDFSRHFDYIHFNPIKHGLDENPDEWKWSTYHRYLKHGYYGEHRQLFDSNVDAE